MVIWQNGKAPHSEGTKQCRHKTTQHIGHKGQLILGENAIFYQNGHQYHIIRYKEIRQIVIGNRKCWKSGQKQKVRGRFKHKNLFFLARKYQILFSFSLVHKSTTDLYVKSEEKRYKILEAILDKLPKTERNKRNKMRFRKLYDYRGEGLRLSVDSDWESIKSVEECIISADASEQSNADLGGTSMQMTQHPSKYDSVTMTSKTKKPEGIFVETSQRGESSVQISGLTALRALVARTRGNDHIFKESYKMQRDCIEQESLETEPKQTSHLTEAQKTIRKFSKSFDTNSMISNSQSEIKRESNNILCGTIRREHGVTESYEPPLSMEEHKPSIDKINVESCPTKDIQERAFTVTVYDGNDVHKNRRLYLQQNEIVDENKRIVAKYDQIRQIVLGKRIDFFISLMHSDKSISTFSVQREVERYRILMEIMDKLPNTPPIQKVRGQIRKVHEYTGDKVKYKKNTKACEELAKAINLSTNKKNKVQTSSNCVSEIEAIFNINMNQKEDLKEKTMQIQNLSLPSPTSSLSKKGGKPLINENIKRINTISLQLEIPKQNVERGMDKAVQANLAKQEGHDHLTREQVTVTLEDSQKMTVEAVDQQTQQVMSIKLDKIQDCERNYNVTVNLVNAQEMVDSAQKFAKMNEKLRRLQYETADKKNGVPPIMQLQSRPLSEPWNVIKEWDGQRARWVDIIHPNTYFDPLQKRQEPAQETDLMKEINQWDERRARLVSGMVQA